MANKVSKRTTKEAAGDSPAALSELSPDITITVAGRNVTVREYGFFEGLDVAQRAVGLIADMRVMCEGGELNYTRIRRLFAQHRDLVVELAAQSADVEPGWVRGLESDRKGSALFFDTWFGVNSSFFMHEVVNEMRDARAATSIGMALSQNSQVPASATSIESAGSPSGK
ncbi:DUF6631 family protein [Stenotrophomonas terrae]|uniref:DUF6631 family protein n=1 Tax=Stenotrophomonas terrae TaxID=405446 RepID=UPI00320A9465